MELINEKALDERMRRIAEEEWLSEKEIYRNYLRRLARWRLIPFSDQ